MNATPLPDAFIHRTATSRLVMAPNALDGLRGELETLGIQRGLLLASARMQASDMYRRVLAACGDRVLQADAPVPAHSSVAFVERLASWCKEQGVDGFIALGGGSASDTAKAIALLMAEGGRLEDHAVRFTPPSTLIAPPLLRPKLPIVSIPGTASGAEVTGSLGIRNDDGAKLLFTDVQLAARVVLLDPDANIDVPASLMCATGMNGLAHCIEGLYSRERSPLAETIAIDAMPRFARALPAVHARPQDTQARADLLYAAHLSGLVLLNARTCLHHAVCHAIGSITGAGHGAANAVLLPHSVAFNADHASDALARAAVALGAGSSAADLIAGLTSLQAACGVPTRLRDIGVAPTDLDRIAAKTLRERGLYYNPRTVVDAAEIRGLLDAAF